MEDMSTAMINKVSLSVIACIAFIAACVLIPSTTFAAAARPLDVSEGCYANYINGTVAGCTDAEIKSADSANGVSGQSDTGGAVPGTTQRATVNTPSQYTPSDKTSCSILSAGTWFQNCLWIPLMSWLGSWFLSLGGAALRLAGTLFDSMIYHVIVDFGQTLTTLGITDAINAGWTVFRDFTNILIIGMFVFVAIGIILGLETFGKKRLIANVLIIAVLLNFSLLFTRVIINASNFTAFTIYKQMAGGSVAGAANFDIAAGFLKPMGITSVWNDTYEVTNSVGKNAQSAMAAFFYGLVGGIMLLTLAGVLFYGCFLIIARGILFIFLMLTAALAFATYMVPSLADGEFGWKAWWKSLFNNAIFAPLLMVFLAISLVIIQAAGLKDGSARASIGQVISDPKMQITSDAWTTILIYCLGTALLFLSFKMASKFAGTMSGFSMVGLASVFARVPLQAALAGGSAILGGSLRNTLGRGAAGQSRDVEAKIKRLATLAGAKDISATQKALYEKELVSAQKQKTRLDSLAGREFNVLGTTLGKTLGKTLGVEAGKAKGGFAGRAKEDAKEAVKKASGLTVTKTEAENEIRAAFKEQHKDNLASIASQQKVGEELKKSVLDAANRTAESHTAELNKHIQDKQSAITQINDLDRDVKSGRITETQHRQLLQEQTERIKQADIAIKQKNAEIETIHGEHLASPQGIEALSVLNEAKRRSDEMKQLENKHVQGSDPAAVAQNSLNNAARITASTEHLNSHAEYLTAKELRSQVKNKRLFDMAKAFKDVGTDGESKSSGDSSKTA